MFSCGDTVQFLDTPGEYFIDTSAGMLYYLPPTPLTAASEVCCCVHVCL